MNDESASPSGAASGGTEALSLPPAADRGGVVVTPLTSEGSQGREMPAPFVNMRLSVPGQGR